MTKVKEDNRELKIKEEKSQEPNDKGIKQKLKGFFQTDFWRIHMRNFAILLIIFFTIFLMINVFLKTEKITFPLKIKYFVEAAEELNIPEDVIDEGVEKYIFYAIQILFNKATILTLLLIFAVYLILKGITGNSKIACLCILIFSLIFEILNYIVMDLRGGGITLADIYSLQAAVNVMGGIRINLDGFFLAGIFIFLVALLLILGLEIKEKKTNIWQRIMMVVIGVIFIVGIAGTQYVKNMMIWDVNVMYKANATPLSLLKMTTMMQVKKPENYRKENVENILASFEDTKDVTGDKPNVIAIMNESFYDFYGTGKISMSQDPLPFYRELITRQNVVSGTMYTSEFGGGTANVEYEFLTQNSTAFLPIGTIPYQQYIKENRDNLANNFKDLGYQTSAIHSWYRNGYTRSKVYPMLGFENVKFYEDMPELEKIFNNNHTTDASTYGQIIKQLEEKDPQKPLFNFTVTMQNHMGYNTEEENGIEYVETDELNCYLQLTHQSDIALADLIGYLEQYDEKIILLFFGDHQPNIESINQEEENIEKYKVPFFIWANYDIEEQQKVEISTNYLASLLFECAGLPKTQYMQYMTELRKSFPIITKKYYQDENAEFYEMTNQLTKEYEKMEDYQKVIYYKMFE